MFHRKHTGFHVDSEFFKGESRHVPEDKHLGIYDTAGLYASPRPMRDRQGPTVQKRQKPTAHGMVKAGPVLRSQTRRQNRAALDQFHPTPTTRTVTAAQEPPWPLMGAVLGILATVVLLSRLFFSSSPALPQRESCVSEFTSEEIKGT